MARKRSRASKYNYSQNYNSRRVGIHNANRRLPAYTVTPSTSSLKDLEDLRTFNPTNRLVGYSGTVVKHNRNTIKKQTKAPLRFRHPERVVVCVRRSIRKEVIHAKGIAGRKGLRKPKYNLRSNISCKR